MAKLGHRVLLLCFTDALGIFFKECIFHSNLQASSIRQFALGQLRASGETFIEEYSSEFWEMVSLRAAIYGLPPEKDRWDFVIVDEGQDFNETDWILAEECSRKTNRLWVFADDDQAFWPEREIPETEHQKWFRYNLKKPYRCPPAIQNLSDCYHEKTKSFIRTNSKPIKGVKKLLKFNDNIIAMREKQIDILPEFCTKLAINAKPFWFFLDR
jgi:hypothetical protein